MSKSASSNERSMISAMSASRSVRSGHRLRFGLLGVCRSGRLSLLDGCRLLGRGLLEILAALGRAELPQQRGRDHTVRLQSERALSLLDGGRGARTQLAVHQQLLAGAVRQTQFVQRFLQSLDAGVPAFLAVPGAALAIE